MGDKSRQGNIPECPDDLDAKLWVYWHSLLDREDAIWLAHATTEIKAATKKDAITLLIQESIGTLSRQHFDNLKKLETTNGQLFTRSLKWLRVPDEFLPTAAWICCKDNLEEVMALTPEEARSFLSNTSDAPELHVLKAVPKIERKSPSTTPGETKTPVGSNNTNNSTGKTNELDVAVLDHYRGHSGPARKTHKSKPRLGDGNPKFNDKARPKRKKSQERRDRSQSRSRSPVRKTKPRNTTRTASPTGDSHDSSDEENDIIPGCENVKPRIIDLITKGQFVDITDCMPCETHDEEGLLLTPHGIRPSHSSTRPSIPTNFDEWYGGATNLCRIRAHAEPTTSTSNLEYIDYVRLLYKLYHPATVYAYDSSWRTFCAAKNIMFYPISNMWPHGQLILNQCRSFRAASSSRHCELCQSIHHSTWSCFKHGKMYVPRDFFPHNEKGHKETRKFARGSTKYPYIYPKPPAQSHSNRKYQRQRDPPLFPCTYFNNTHGCRNSAVTCRYRHSCATCQSTEHGEASCPNRAHEKRHRQGRQRS